MVRKISQHCPGRNINPQRLLLQPQRLGLYLERYFPIAVCKTVKKIAIDKITMDNGRELPEGICF